MTIIYTVVAKGWERLWLSAFSWWNCRTGSLTRKTVTDLVSGSPDEIRMGYLVTVKHYTARCWLIKP